MIKGSRLLYPVEVLPAIHFAVDRHKVLTQVDGFVDQKTGEMDFNQLQVIVYIDNIDTSSRVMSGLGLMTHYHES